MAPSKLVRQAYGLLRAAALRSGHLEDGRKIPDQLDGMWAAVVEAATGLRWAEHKPKVSLCETQLLTAEGKRYPGGVIQGSEMDVTRTVPAVRTICTTQDTPLGDFYRHFCGSDED